ncbi:MAG: ferrous iron transport protein A [Verrucomicrobia bacterium]|nr:MAG: ferrous iron transport protein A [Verrucomicrobiota bacterium]
MNKTKLVHHRLNELPSGSLGIVRQLDNTDAALHRLMAMGMCVGREVKVVRQGNPLIIQLLSARIGVSARLARQVMLELCPAAKQKSQHHAD